MSMTEREAKAIKWMKNVIDNAVVTLDEIEKNHPHVSPMLYAGRKDKAETIIEGFEELEKYRAIGTVSEFRELKEINEKITEAANGQLIAGKNNYKEAYECFHKIVDIVQGRIDWSEGKE